MINYPIAATRRMPIDKGALATTLFLLLAGVASICVVFIPRYQSKSIESLHVYYGIALIVSAILLCIADMLANRLAWYKEYIDVSEEWTSRALSSVHAGTTRLYSQIVGIVAVLERDVERPISYIELAHSLWPLCWCPKCQDRPAFDRQLARLVERGALRESPPQYDDDGLHKGLRYSLVGSTLSEEDIENSRISVQWLSGRVEHLPQFAEET